MAGTISSLGLASGTLTSDVIDKLKAADKASTVTPYETKIKNNETQSSDLTTLKDLTEELETLTSNLSSESSYAGVTAATTGDTATVTAKSGTSVQSFELNVGQLAQKKITQSDGFESETSSLNKSGDLKFTIDGKDYTVSITNSMSLKDVKDAIYEGTDGKVVGSSLKTGGNNPYSLVLKSSETGKQNDFVLNDGVGFNFSTKQEAQDAIFDYDGVRINRSSNEISDLIAGVTINLKDSGKIDSDGNITGGKTTVNIKQKTTDIVENVSKFVEKYNKLIANLNTVTSYDSEKKVKGTFQGNNEMNSIKQQIKNSLLVTSGVLEDFGITIKRSGELEFKSSTLESKISSNFSEVKNFFMGANNSTGLFSNVKDTLRDLTSSNNGLFKIIEDNLKTKNTSLSTAMESAQARLDTKYEIMQKKFAAYDAMISNMNNSFSSLKLIINQSTSSS